MLSDANPYAAPDNSARPDPASRTESRHPYQRRVIPYLLGINILDLVVLVVHGLLNIEPFAPLVLWGIIVIPTTSFAISVHCLIYERHTRGGLLWIALSVVLLIAWTAIVIVCVKGMYRARELWEQQNPEMSCHVGQQNDDCAPLCFKPMI